MGDDILPLIIESLRGDLKSIIEISEELKRDRTFISGYLRSLCELGVLKNKKAGSNKVYRIENLDSLKKLRDDL